MSTNVADLSTAPDEVILEVVSRLPVKKLIQSKCICKRWLRLISSSSNSIIIIRYLHDFDYNRLPRKTNQFLVFWSKTSETLISTLKFNLFDVFSGVFHSSFVYHYPTPDIGGLYGHSTHGLVCFTDNYGYQIRLCNPSTREVVDIPECPFGYVGIVGLGFVPSSNQYKIVRCSIPFIGFEIFTLTCGATPGSTGASWRRLANTIKFEAIANQIQPLCINGVIHWLVAVVCGQSGILSILSFDLESETPKVISLPVVVDVDGDQSTVDVMTDVYLVELRESLCFVQNLNNNTCTTIWSLKDVTSQKWVRLYAITYRPRVVTSVISDDRTEELVSIPGLESNRVSYYNTTTRKVTESKHEVEFPMNGQPCLFYDSLFSFGSKTFP